MWLSFQQCRETGYEALNQALSEQQASHPSWPPKTGAGGFGETDCVYVFCGLYWCFEIPNATLPYTFMSLATSCSALVHRYKIRILTSHKTVSFTSCSPRSTDNSKQYGMLTPRLYLLLLLTDLTFAFGPVYQIHCEPLSHPAPPLTLSSCQDAVTSIPVNSFPAPTQTM